MPSYEQNKSSKLWSVRFREINDGKEQQKRLSGFKTKREAQAGYVTYQAKREQQLLLEGQKKNATPDEMPFSTLVDAYLSYTKTRVKESSYTDIESKIRNRIRPYFDSKRVCDITPLGVLKWQQQILEQYTYEYCYWCISRLSSIYKYGERYHDITNIMHKVDRPRNLEPKKEMQFWTAEQFTTFIAGITSPAYEAFFRTLYLIGCRRGEANALTWRDVDLAAGTIRINKSLTTKVKNTPYKVTTPKNGASNRTLKIPPAFCRYLSSYKERMGVIDPQYITKDAFVFGGTTPLPPSSVDHLFKKTIRTTGVPEIRIHDLRHSCASLLISKGVSIVAVSRYLGHTNTQQTLNTYSHMMPDDQTYLLGVLENACKI